MLAKLKLKPGIKSFIYLPVVVVVWYSVGFCDHTFDTQIAMLQHANGTKS